MDNLNVNQIKTQLYIDRKTVKSKPHAGVGQCLSVSSRTFLLIKCIHWVLHTNECTNYILI